MKGIHDNITLKSPQSYDWYLSLILRYFLHISEQTDGTYLIVACIDEVVHQTEPDFFLWLKYMIQVTVNIYNVNLSTSRMCNGPV